jgi:signal transduction histidine kinase/ligand-binding sensor domain-containing protein
MNTDERRLKIGVLSALICVHRRLLILALACSGAFALNPAFDISQYAHTSWKYRDGFTKGEIHAMAQSADGYLWLATSFGLYRFDGVRATPWAPPNQPLPSNDVLHLVAARDGVLWIGTRNGLASWKNGMLAQYAELAGLNIFALLEDREGVIWAGGFGLQEGKLCEIRQGAIRCHPEIGGLGRGVMGLQEDARGNLWAGLQAGVWRWKPGPPEFYVSRLGPVQSMENSGDGGVLVSLTGGIYRPVKGGFQLQYGLPAPMRESQASDILHDRDGGLWGGTRAGLVHWRQERTDIFTESDGLTGNRILHLFEDHEGNIWAATNNGLDRFRELPAVTYSGKQGLPGPPDGAVFSAGDGSVWFSTYYALDRLDHGQLTVYHPQTAPVSAGVREILVRGLPPQLLASFAQDSRGRIWFSSQSASGYLENGRFISAAPGGVVTAILNDPSGNVWIAYQNLGLVRWSESHEPERIPWEVFSRNDLGRSLAADPLQGGIWLGFFKGGIAYFRDGNVRASYSAANGLAAGSVYSLEFDSEGVLWAAAEGGLSRLKKGRIDTLTSRNGLPCNSVHWMLEDDDRSLWLMTACGLVRVARSELIAWDASPDKAGWKIKPTIFDASDGVTSRPSAGAQTPHAAKSPDGKLWFWNEDGIGMIDPRHLLVNKLPPPVEIEQITADRKTYAAAGRVRLPPLVRDLEIDYTALSFVAPEKIRFKYKLEGHDRDWEEVGNRRQAFYTDLPPRRYRFRVMAANNSGVWNEAGASLDFSVDPAYYQTTWFRALVVAAFLALLAAFYQLRLIYLKRQFAVRMEARVNERMRLARDLHDTLLQSFQGVLLKFHAVTFRLGDRPEAKKDLDAAIEQARAAIAEGRDAVQGLRSSVALTNDLARAITTLGEGLASDQNGAEAPDFRVAVEGASRDLAPLVRDEAYRIGGEALRNAFRHANAKRIEVEIHYEARLLRLRVRDDGKGIDRQVLGAGGRGGHHGLPGMRERAELVGGKLAVWSELHSGTEIDLVIPAAIAYAKTQTAGTGGQTTL